MRKLIFLQMKVELQNYMWLNNIIYINIYYFNIYIYYFKLLLLLLLLFILSKSKINMQDVLGDNTIFPYISYLVSIIF